MTAKIQRSSSALLTSPQSNAPDNTDAGILALIRATANSRSHAADYRRRLKEKASWFTHFNHFRGLCIGDLREAFADDRRDKTRTAKNRRLTWLAMFRFFATHAGIERDLKIIALDRQGNYACELVDKVSPDDWATFVCLGERYGITEKELTALWQAKQRQAA